MMHLSTPPGQLFPADQAASAEQEPAASQPAPENAPAAVRRALLFGVVPALRAGPEAAQRIALEVIERAARDRSSATRQLGSLIVGREVATHRPLDALALVERWAASDDPARQWQAARAMTPQLRTIDPQRAALIRARLEQSPDASVRNALRGALKASADNTSGVRGGAEATVSGWLLGEACAGEEEEPGEAISGHPQPDLVAARDGAHAPAAGGSPVIPPGWQTTADIPISARLIDQVIGQDEAVDIVRLAARQRRFVLMVGEPGTGKSMLAAAMAEMMGAEALEDVLVLPNSETRISPLIQTVPAGDGEHLVREAKKRRSETEMAITFLFWSATIATAIVAGWYALATRSAVPAVVAAIVVAVLWVIRRLVRAPSRHPVPKLMVNNARALEQNRAPFVDATGFHAGALLGDVRHDPFQSGGYETPPHELVEAGAIHLAHRGVLFIDEVSTLSIESQQSLLTAIQEKRFPISGRTLGSSGTMIRSAPAPCDFVLILAGNMQDVEKMHPALRSRVRGYGYELYMAEDMPDTEENRAKLARFCAQEVAKDGKIPPLTREAVAAVIEEARVRSGRQDRLTVRLRELGGLIRAAGDLAVHEGAPVIEARHVAAARRNTRTLEEQMRERHRARQNQQPDSGERQGLEPDRGDGRLPGAEAERPRATGARTVGPVVATVAALVTLLLAGCSQPAPREVTVTTQNFRFLPATFEWNRQQPIRLTLRNPDTIEHDFQVDGLYVREGAGGHSHSHSGGTEDGHAAGTLHLHVDAGREAVVVFTPLTRGTFTAYCTIPGHKELGMTATITVR